MPSVELSAGPIDFEDTGGDSPVLVLLHGVPMDGRLWRRALPYLGGFRVIGRRCRWVVTGSDAPRRGPQPAGCGEHPR